MMKKLWVIFVFWPIFALAEELTTPNQTQSIKEGTTIIGDQELPQVLYLIPWKSPVIRPTPRPEFVAERYVDLLNPCDLPESYWPDSGHRWPCKSLYADKNQLLR